MRALILCESPQIAQHGAYIVTRIREGDNMRIDGTVARLAYPRAYHDLCFFIRRNPRSVTLAENTVYYRGQYPLAYMTSA